MTIDQIKKLKEKASASPWSNLHNGDHEADKDFLMHSHKIADTAIKALEEVERLKEELATAVNEANQEAEERAYQQEKEEGYQEGFVDGKNQ